MRRVVFRLGKALHPAADLLSVFIILGSPVKRQDERDLLRCVQILAAIEGEFEPFIFGELPLSREQFCKRPFGGLCRTGRRFGRCLLLDPVPVGLGNARQRNGEDLAVVRALQRHVRAVAGDEIGIELSAIEGKPLARGGCDDCAEDDRRKQDACFHVRHANRKRFAKSSRRAGRRQFLICGISREKNLRLTPAFHVLRHTAPRNAC